MYKSALCDKMEYQPLCSHPLLLSQGLTQGGPLGREGTLEGMLSLLTVCRRSGIQNLKAAERHDSTRADIVHFL